MNNLKSQQEKEAFLTYVRELNRDIYDSVNNVSSEVKREKHLPYLIKEAKKLVDEPINILDFYNDKIFQCSRKSRLGEKLYNSLRKEEIIALPFYFPELEGLILKDSHL